MLRRWTLLVLLASIGLLFSACTSGTNAPPSESLERRFTFATDTAGWTSVFADYDTDADTTDDGMALTFDRRPLPDEVPDGYGLFLSGRNSSDDLFMGLRRPLTDLQPNTRYDLTVEVTLASAAPSNCVGIGGAPGEAVWVKAGGAATKPKRIADDSGRYRLSVNKGGQSQGGDAARVLGNAANGIENCHDSPYRLIKRKMDPPLPVTTTDDGKLWLLVGTDSGFEGTTSLYYDAIRVVLEPR